MGHALGHALCICIRPNDPMDQASGLENESASGGTSTDTLEPTPVDPAIAREQLLKQLLDLQQMISGYLLLRQDDARRGKIDELRRLSTKMKEDIQLLDEVVAIVSLLPPCVKSHEHVPVTSQRSLSQTISPEDTLRQQSF